MALSVEHAFMQKDIYSCAAKAATNTLWKAHDIEDPIQLVMVIRVAGLDVLLTTVKYRF